MYFLRKERECDLLTTGQILFAYEDERGEDVIEAIDFWKNNRRSDMIGSPGTPPDYAR